MQRTPCNAQRTTCNAQRTPCNTQHATHNAQHATHNAQHATHNMQRTTKGSCGSRNGEPRGPQGASESGAAVIDSVQYVGIGGEIHPRATADGKPIWPAPSRHCHFRRGGSGRGCAPSRTHGSARANQADCRVWRSYTTCTRCTQMPLGPARLSTNACAHDA
jgi:hypothetical protein